MKKTAFCFALATAFHIASPVLAAEEARTYTPDEIKRIVRETIMDDPKIILEAVDKWQREEERKTTQQARDNITAYKTSLFESKTSPTQGAKNADVTLVEFFDYNCGYCRRSYPNVLQLLDEDKKLKVVFKELPLLSPTSETAARAALAVNFLKPEKYLDYHSALFKLNGKFDEDTLAKTAESLGINGEKVKKEMRSERVNKELEDTRNLAAKLGMRGVPAFVIGEDALPGAVDIAVLRDYISKMREKKKN